MVRRAALRREAEGARDPGGTRIAEDAPAENDEGPRGARAAEHGRSVPSRMFVPDAELLSQPRLTRAPHGQACREDARALVEPITKKPLP